jgi:hypothetical protein
MKAMVRLPIAPVNRDGRTRWGSLPHHSYPAPVITWACNDCPHIARNALERLRDCLLRGTPGVAWQPKEMR